MRMVVIAGLVALTASGCLGESAAPVPPAALRVEIQIERQVVPGTDLRQPAQPSHVVCTIVQGGTLAECVGRFPELLPGSGKLEREPVPMSFHLRAGRLAGPDCDATHGWWSNPFCVAHGGGMRWTVAAAQELDSE